MGKKYEPSFNIAPTDITPVLTSRAHFTDDENDSSDHIIVPMLWGMIPRWHKGDYKRHGLTTNNCRLENLLESKLYSAPLKQGQRCVIVCEGFYEWQTVYGVKSSERSVYYIYMPQNETGKKEDIKPNNEMKNMNLLKMAGLFDIWEDENGNKMYSYTVITFESHEKFVWLHHRIPAILETEDQINDWLDYKNVPYDRALKLLTPADNIIWHQVSKMVNNTRNKDSNCNKDLKYMKNNIPKSNLMQSWLSKGTLKRKSESETCGKDETPGKKTKTE